MAIKRRIFIKNTAFLATATGLCPTLVHAVFNTSNQKELQNFLLKGFEEEQEEYPSLVGNQNGDLWIFSLRRLKYPNNSELVSSFQFNGKNWTETNPITPMEGQYEAPSAACSPKGKPVVAWNSIEKDRWKINVAHLGANGHWKRHQFEDQPGKPVNPVLHTPTAERTWIAWENFHQGKFSIFISKYQSGKWSAPFEIKKRQESCFDPALVETKNGDLYVAYGLTDGYHQNIEMILIDGQSFQLKKIIPVATGGLFENRINLNTKPALAFDRQNRLWISYESNRNASRMDDADNYTGDRCCAILSYQKGKIVEPKGSGKWLFNDKNDHRPTFIQDQEGKLYLATHCGGDFVQNPYWKYRISSLDEHKGWTSPKVILESKQKGPLIPPAFAFHKNDLYISTLLEDTFDHERPESDEQIVRSRLTQLMVYQLPKPQLESSNPKLKFKTTEVEGFHQKSGFIPERSGRPKVVGEQLSVNGKMHTLAFGNLHEHTENSSCWPAGTEGTLHEEYRFGMYSEGYNFMGITDHGYTMTEVYWRKNYRLADFYNDPPYFVTLPAMEWTFSARGDLENVPGAGHYNIVFSSSDEARKFIRNSDEVYNVNTPETSNPVKLWQLLREKQIDCVTIPHHPASRRHPVDWHVHDPEFVSIVEIFQCRGNAEYPGAPRNIQAQRHRPTDIRRTFIDYALNKMQYKMGFIASGDHNNMGVGVAALWVKELSRKGILEALRNRSCFATTGDKMVVDFRINDSFQGTTVKTSSSPNLSMKVRGQRPLAKIEILHNSKVIKELTVEDNQIAFEASFTDETHFNKTGVCYYYVRATQQNNEIAWSSPIWVEQA